jgi:hypothetical protein
MPPHLVEKFVSSKHQIRTVDVVETCRARGKVHDSRVSAKLYRHSAVLQEEFRSGLCRPPCTKIEYMVQGFVSRCCWCRPAGKVRGIKLRWRLVQWVRSTMSPDITAGAVKKCSRYCRSELMHARCVNGLTYATSSCARLSSSLSGDVEHAKSCHFHSTRQINA